MATYFKIGEDFVIKDPMYFKGREPRLTQREYWAAAGKGLALAILTGCIVAGMAYLALGYFS
jgi:hypothetical protein